MQRGQGSESLEFAEFGHGKNDLPMKEACNSQPVGFAGGRKSLSTMQQEAFTQNHIPFVAHVQDHVPFLCLLQVGYHDPSTGGATARNMSQSQMISNSHIPHPTLGISWCRLPDPSTGLCNLQKDKDPSLCYPTCAREGKCRQSRLGGTSRRQGKHLASSLAVTPLTHLRKWTMVKTRSSTQERPFFFRVGETHFHWRWCSHSLSGSTLVYAHPAPCVP
uniref:Uncharacterized protein n=1 Tax=Eutreptiella gymnastica TaxID=73025 RepID=A0A7S1HVN3_9EUGL|mmetsp:Transcript_108277/g.187029  ORF Transcript_108277/g.187029 Transcript_108277/m.187029 type:complete len:219 (+) Transcript_108277:469-1125(+)